MPTNTDERPRVYLNKVHLKGYKSIEDVTIDFQKGLNILIGKNGAGKSNLLEFVNQAVSYKQDTIVQFRFAQLGFIDEDSSFVFEIERKLRARVENDDPKDRIKVYEKLIVDDEVVFDNSQRGEIKTAFKYKNRLIPYRGLFRLFPKMGYQNLYPFYIKYGLPEHLGFIDVAGELTLVTEDGFNIWDFPETLNFLQAIIFGLDSTYGGKSKNELNGLGLSDVRQNMKVQDDIIGNLRLFTPIENVRINNNINLYREEKKIIIDNIKLEFKVSGNWLPWSQLSDGTRRLFYIVAEVTFTNGLVLLEEPELGVHPHQFHLLMNFLKEQSEHKQIIISTHAPKALDHLSLDELNNILLVNYDQKNGTQLRHLTGEEQAKAQEYAKEVGYVSDYWMYSDLEE